MLEPGRDADLAFLHFRDQVFQTETRILNLLSRLADNGTEIAVKYC